NSRTNRTGRRLPMVDYTRRAAGSGTSSAALIGTGSNFSLRSMRLPSSANQRRASQQRRKSRIGEQQAPVQRGACQQRGPNREDHCGATLGGMSKQELNQAAEGRRP